MEEVIAKAKVTKWLYVRDIILMTFFIGFLLIIVDFINDIGTKLQVTNKKVSGKIGILKSKTLEAPLNKISGVSVSKGVLGTILKYGTVVITTSSATFEFKNISNPNKFAEIVNQQIEKYEDERIRKQAEEIAKSIK